ncbi:MAG: hypothetical protein JXA79_11245 [Deltaproteobacteria bacterium]|nr:hypothetical protein [Deltaproteobacteria bacterium]
MSVYYLRIEAVNLDYSVYDTYDISTIRGGSFMLHNAFEGIEQKVNKLSLPCQDFKDLGSAASAGLYTFKPDTNDIESRIVKPILNLILEEIRSFATLVWSTRPVRKNEPFADFLNYLLAECRWKQYQQASVVLPLEKDRDEACAMDGVRPAVEPDQVGDKERLISRAVSSRRRKGKELRNRIYKELLGEIVSALPDKPDEWIVTSNLEMLSKRKEAGKLDGKIAFIFLDGNRFGRIRDAKCANPDLYLQFQQTIQNELRKPALEALLQFALAPENQSFRTDDNKIRLETLLWGGDEIEWIVPAWQALNVLDLFFNTTKAHDNFHGVTLTHSAGVVFCHHNLPILQIRQYARELCELAKEKEEIPRDINKIGPDANRFAFLNIVSFDYMTGNMREFIRSYYHPAGPKDFIIPADSIGDFKRYLPMLKSYFPSNKLHQLIEALKKKQYDEVNKIFKKAISLLGRSQREATQAAFDKLIADKNQLWFRVAELMNYVE